MSDALADKLISSQLGHGEGGMMKTILIAFALLLTGCVGLPENVKPVDHFNSGKYLGKWYEIARLDHSFERGLSKVSANYSMRDDGGIRVINRGYDAQKSSGRKPRARPILLRAPTNVT